MHPDLAGQRIEGLIFEGFVHRGQRVNSVNVVYLKTDGVWTRLALDAGTVHWREEPSEPQPWAVAEEGWDYPHTDAGSEYQLLGAEIASLASVQTGNAITVELRFSDGRRAIFRNASDHTSFLLFDANAEHPPTRTLPRPGAA
jgi:hypothetical protein